MASKQKTTKSRKSISEFFRFLLIGGVSTIVDWGVFATLTFFSLNNLIALSISYGCGAIVNYIGNRCFTFRSIERRVVRQFTVFMTVVICNLLLSLFVFSLLNSLLKYIVVISAYSSIIARIITTFFIFIVNYTLHKYITFNVR